ncbi:MAG: anti-sigma factor family protein [Candidatus Villigracilaceae bacterium]
MHPQFNCDDLLGSLSDYLDGEAQEEICRAIEAHMAECPNCRIIVDTLKKTIYLVHATAAPKLPNDVRERLYQTLKLDDFLKK